MNDSFDATNTFILRWEGGYSSIAADAGNWSAGRVRVGTLIGSNMGVSAPTLIDWLGRVITAAEMRALSSDIQAAIFGAHYWNLMGAYGLPAGVDLAVVDFGYNAGAKRSAMMLQDILGVAQDGSIGPETQTAAVAKDATVLIEALINAQRSYYQSLDNPLDEKGWLNRCDARQTAALALVGKEPS